MRTLSKLLSAPVIAGMLGALAMTASVPAMARDHDRGGHWRGEHHEYHHRRGDHDRDWGWGGPSVSFGFGYPYYNSGYYGYRGYNCDPNSWYYDPDECYGGGHYGYYGDWDD